MFQISAKAFLPYYPLVEAGYKSFKIFMMNAIRSENTSYAMQ